jgi:intracellular multiplication protein IcmQ
MNNDLTKQQIDAIIKILDDLTALGGWDSSTFMRVISKKLLAIRDDFVSKSGAYRPEKLKMTSNLANRVAMRSGQQEIFISLYSMDGANLQAWERIVNNLPKQIISRPIYADEENANQLIRSKENKLNEAYVAIYINQSDIIPMGDKTPTDRLGKPLLTLKDKSLSLNNINRFVHVSGVYQYLAGKLIKESS